MNTVGVMLRGEGGGISRAARWSRNWFCPAAQGQIRYTTETNMPKYSDIYATLQRQIRYIREKNSNTLLYWVRTSPIA